MLKYIPYVLLFALVTMIVYAWGMWRSMRQQQDLSNMLSAKGISKVKKSIEEKRFPDRKGTGAFHKRSDGKAAIQQGTDRRDRSEEIS